MLSRTVTVVPRTALSAVADWYGSLSLLARILWMIVLFQGIEDIARVLAS